MVTVPMTRRKSGQTISPPLSSVLTADHAASKNAYGGCYHPWFALGVSDNSISDISSLPTAEGRLEDEGGGGDHGRIVLVVFRADQIGLRPPSHS
jgi:hypothetical protein